MDSGRDSAVGSAASVSSSADGGGDGSGSDDSSDGDLETWEDYAWALRMCLCVVVDALAHVLLQRPMSLRATIACRHYACNDAGSETPTRMSLSLTHTPPSHHHHHHHHHPGIVA
jgi:hypothetical protein